MFGEVDGPEGTKIKATILYPNEPKRRLEVIWNNDAARTDLSMVVINGQSQWAAPKGLKLGTPLAALEKINGRPFKLSGFDADGSASVLGWEGGALTSLPGGCKVGVRLAADSKAAGSRARREGIAVQRRQFESHQSVGRGNPDRLLAVNRRVAANCRNSARIAGTISLRLGRRTMRHATSATTFFDASSLAAALAAPGVGAELRTIRHSATAPTSPTAPSR